MKKSKKLVFFGNERLATGLPAIEPVILPALASAGYEIEAVIASHIDSTSRQKRDLEIGPIAQSLDVPVVLAGPGTDLLAKAKRHQTDTAILVAFGRLIPNSVLELFPGGIINLHPSLLPQYRGSTPIEQAILDGASKTGVSLMRLTQGMDEGPVYAQKTVHLKGDETKAELAEQLLRAGSDLLIEKLPDILSGRLKPHRQPHPNRASYTRKLIKDDGMVDWNKPAEVLEREIRAFAGWPKSQAQIFGKEVIITKARAAKSKDDGELVVKSGEGWLEIQELIAPSGKMMSGANFIRGYKK